MPVGTPGTIGRPLYGGTPQNSNSDVSGYTTSWQTYFGPTAYVTANGYKLQFTTSHYLGFSGGTYNYEMKARPFRWLAGGGTDDNNYVSDMVIAKGCQNRFTGPPSNCHMGNVKAEGLTYTVPAAVISGGSSVTINIENSRVVVDGVDASGIFAESGNTQNRYVPFTSQKTMTAKAFYLECWFKINAAYSTIVTTPRDAIYVTDISYPIASPFTNASGKMSFTGGDIRKGFPTTKTVRLTFDRGGPGGVSSLDLEAQSGWTFSETTGQITMTHGSTGDVVLFVYNVEVPYVEVAIAADSYAAMQSTCVYYPQGTEYESVYKYRTTGLFESLYTMPQRGPWINSASQDFYIEGRKMTSFDARLYGVYYPEAYLDSVPVTDAMYTNFPRVVSVELV